MCVIRGSEQFLKGMCRKLLPDLTAIALTGLEHDTTQSLPNQYYESAFRINLVKRIKNWGELHMIMDGAKSEFCKSYENLKNAGLDFKTEVKIPRPEIKKRQPLAPRPLRHTEKLSLAAIEEQGKEILAFAVQFDRDTWTTDREIVNQVYSKAKSLKEQLNVAIDQTEQYPDMDLSGMLNLNTKLSELIGLISRAAKGDIAAASKIANISNPNPEGNTIMKCF